MKQVIACIKPSAFELVTEGLRNVGGTDLDECNGKRRFRSR